ncbi:VPLPA-CTERM sorting domain-containing protein [Paracoccus sp. (in: a-proteobacteria)]|uniref:VPLPA-CTERM sorting domain-containing protein n=1 Tax=Paracoccus sp. TaxID=267 RepID=UPI0026DF01A4|nr:VPLPA-CTERM sorting domain-containing protein [Paracoccus sp. (in: a-proteobacteria)]MDO5647313.1 VPLPA-CTERM sorting domain-containing protein [Paracoccus sp. (in: a-proteobacteria)]
MFTRIKAAACAAVLAVAVAAPGAASVVWPDEMQLRYQVTNEGATGKYKPRAGSTTAGGLWGYREVSYTYGRSSGATEQTDPTGNNVGEWNGVAANVGRFHLETTIAGQVRQFTAFCLELSHGMFGARNPNGTVQLVTYEKRTILDQERIDRIAKLVHRAWDEGMKTVIGQIAFQLALWEITHDDGYDLSAGRFRVSANARSTYSVAQTWLNDISRPDYTGTRYMMMLHHATVQDLLTDIPLPPPAPVNPPAVPLPASGFLLLGGLAGLGWLRRKRA